MEGFFKEAGLALEDAAHPPAPTPPEMERFLAISRKYHTQARSRLRLPDCQHPGLGVSEVVNLHDPDGNGIELTYDRPWEEWPRVDRQLRMYIRRVDRDKLLAELEQEGVASA